MKFQSPKTLTSALEQGQRHPNHRLNRQRERRRPGELVGLVGVQEQGGHQPLERGQHHGHVEGAEQRVPHHLQLPQALIAVEKEGKRGWKIEKIEKVKPIDKKLILNIDFCYFFFCDIFSRDRSFPASRIFSI